MRMTSTFLITILQEKCLIGVSTILKHIRLRGIRSRSQEECTEGAESAQCGQALVGEVVRGGPASRDHGGVRVMGTCNTFTCEGCGYEDQVSGGRDVGMLAVFTLVLQFVGPHHHKRIHEVGFREIGQQHLQ
jgi:hypothetical protein